MSLRRGPWGRPVCVGGGGGSRNRQVPKKATRPARRCSRVRTLLLIPLLLLPATMRRQPGQDGVGTVMLTFDCAGHVPATTTAASPLPLGRSCGGKFSTASRVQLAQRAREQAAQTRYAQLSQQVSPALTHSIGRANRPSSAPINKQQARPPPRPPMMGEHVPSVPEVHVQRLQESPARPSSASHVRKTTFHPPHPMGLMAHKEVARALAEARRCSGESSPAADGSDEDDEERSPGEQGAKRGMRPRSAPSSRRVVAPPATSPVSAGSPSTSPSPSPSASRRRFAGRIAGSEGDDATSLGAPAPASAWHSPAPAPAPVARVADEMPSWEPPASALPFPDDVALPPRRAIGYASPPPASIRSTRPALVPTPDQLAEEAEEVLAGAAGRVAADVSGIRRKRPNSAPAAKALAAPAPAPWNRPPVPSPRALGEVLSIADLLTPWPLGSVPLQLHSRPASVAPRSSMRTSTRPKVSAPGAGGRGSPPACPSPQPQRANGASAHEAAARQQILRRSQHPFGAHARMSQEASCALEGGAPRCKRPCATSCEFGQGCMGHRCEPAPRHACSRPGTAGAVVHRTPPGAPSAVGSLSAESASVAAAARAAAERPTRLLPGSGERPGAPGHRPAPGRSPGAIQVAEMAGTVARQWAMHPSQADRTNDLRVGSPGQRTGVAHTPSPHGCAPRGAPAHRTPPIRARRPAWERPRVSSRSPERERSDMRRHPSMSLLPTGDAAEASAAGVSATVSAAFEEWPDEMPIAPRCANLSGVYGFVPPPGPTDGIGGAR